MYEICINNEMNNITYKKMIEYAIKKSDAFMLILKNYKPNIEDRYKMMDKDEFIKDFIDEAKEEGSIFDLEETLKLYDLIGKSLEKQKEKAKENRKIFLKSSKLCWDKLKPYLIKGKGSVTSWPSTTIMDDGKGDGVCRHEMGMYRICNETKETLLEANGLFHWCYPELPDDLSFFKNGLCWFFTVAHEEYALIYTEDKEDIQYFKDIGLDFEFEEIVDSKIELFHEEYEL